MTLIGILILIIVLVIGVLYKWSPGTIRPFLDTSGQQLEGSISEKIMVEINCVKQGMIIRGKNYKNPVLLYLHGGPGMPNYVFADNHPTDIEEHFTVCWWEQRGAGLSYDSSSSPDTVTFNQLKADTVAVTKYLCKKFEKNKIYLFGSSWGSFLGIQVAAEYSTLYHAYIGMGQMTNGSKSRELARIYMNEQYYLMGNKKIVNKLKKQNLSHGFIDKRLHELKVGTTRDMTSVISGIFWPIMKHPVYTLSEKINLWRAMFFSGNKKLLFKEMRMTDVIDKIPTIDLPIYFFGGKYDYTTSTVLAKEYYFQLIAPIKGFYTFKHSAHSPLFEEPEKAIQILINDVLKSKTDLADK